MERGWPQLSGICLAPSVNIQTLTPATLRGLLAAVRRKRVAGWAVEVGRQQTDAAVSRGNGCDLSSFPWFHFRSRPRRTSSQASLRAVRGNGTLSPRVSGLLTMSLISRSDVAELQVAPLGSLSCLLQFGSQILPVVFWVLVLVCNAEDLLEGRGCGQRVSRSGDRGEAWRAGQSPAHILGLPAPQAWRMLHLGRELVTGSDHVSHPSGNASTKLGVPQTPQILQQLHLVGVFPLLLNRWGN